MHKMGKEIMKFRDTEIKQHRFHLRKNQILTYDVDVNKKSYLERLTVGKKGFKYFY